MITGGEAREPRAVCWPQMSTSISCAFSGRNRQVSRAYCLAFYVLHIVCSLWLGVCSLSKPSEIRNSRWRLGSVALASQGSGRLRRGYLSQPPMLAFSWSASCNHTFEANTGSLKALPTVAWIAHFSQCPLKRGLALGRIKPPSAAVEMKAGKKQLPCSPL